MSVARADLRRGHRSARRVNDAARWFKLVRGADFACRDRDGSILIASRYRAASGPDRGETYAASMPTRCPGGTAVPAPDIALTHGDPPTRRSSLLARITPSAVAAVAGGLHLATVLQKRGRSAMPDPRLVPRVDVVSDVVAPGASSARSGWNRRSRSIRISRSRCITTLFPQ
jgi:hypothetical protein